MAVLFCKTAEERGCLQRGGRMDVLTHCESPDLKGLTPTVKGGIAREL